MRLQAGQGRVNSDFHARHRNTTKPLRERRMAGGAGASRARPSLYIPCVAVLFLVLVGCTLHNGPELPPSANVVAIAEKVTGSGSRPFLKDITTTAWADGGHRPADLFAWIQRDAQSTDHATAFRAGATAHAVASFLADDRDALVNAPANPALWQAFAHSLAPYLGPMVGDASGIAGFEPLDGTASQMRRTASLFATMMKNADANRIFTDATSARVQKYEAAFAKAAVAEPMLADRGAAAQNELQYAARLRGLVAAGTYLAKPESVHFTPAHAQTELSYQIASLTARPGDPHIGERFFKDGQLFSPSEIAEADWSIYDAQLTVYLSPWPRINEAIRQFGRAYDTIASGQ